MGTALFEVGQILGSHGNVASKSLQLGGVLTVHIEKCQTNFGDEEGILHLQLQGYNCKPPKGSRTANPFYELFRKVDRQSGAAAAVWESVYRSNTIKNNYQRPKWNEVHLNVDAACNGDLNRSIKIVLWDHKRSGKHKYMGECETTIFGLVNATTVPSSSVEDAPAVAAIADFSGFELRRDGKPAGRLHVLFSKLEGGTEEQQPALVSVLEEEPTTDMADNSKRSYASSSRLSHQQQQQRPEFVDYLSAGCQISLAVAIDFTASNGDPREPGTPHYFYPPQSKEWNDYEKAIFAVGSILAKYDSDQRMPVWGFGAKYDDEVRHCFQCGQEAEVDGVQGIMDAYRGVFRTPLTMSCPTKLTEVIEAAATYARREQQAAEEDKQQSYTILLILTSGNVEDVNETKKCLIDCSDDPLSVVIVGIGEANFDSMQFLDDHDPETEGGRDITKFVRFSDFTSFNALTEAVLDEIPQQLVDYYYSRDILPGKSEDYHDIVVKIAEPDNDLRTLTFLG